MQDFKNLTVWKRSHALTLEVFRTTASFPFEEKFGLAAHLRKTAVSVESNLAEGAGRDGKAEFKRFVFIALGSVCELECQLLIAKDLGFMTAALVDRLNGLGAEVRKMGWALARRLQA